MTRALAIALLVVACTDDRRAGAPDKLSRAECERYAERFVQSVKELGAPDLAEELRVERVDGCLRGDTDRKELDCMLAAKTDEAELRCTSEAEARRKSRGRP